MHPRRAKWRRRVRGGPPRTHVVGARGEGGAHKTSLEAVVAGHIEQLDGVGGDGQQQGDLVNLQRGGPLLGDVGDPRAHPHQAGGLQTDLGDDVDAVNGVAPPPRDDDIGGASRSLIHRHLVGDGVDVGGEDGTVLPVKKERGTGRPAQMRQGQHRQVGGSPGAVGFRAHRLGGTQVRQGGVPEVAEILTPVAHDGEAVRQQVQNR